MNNPPHWLQSLGNGLFTRLYLAQAINLLGDSLTWLGLALLAFELAGKESGSLLAGALTLRVLAFVVLSPIAGVLADRVDRKALMITTHIARMGIVCLFPFVTQIWQIYGLVLLLNVFSAFFTPTYTATIPLVTQPEERPGAIALSSATYQLLGVLGPGLAGGIAAWVGTRQVFFLDGLTFLIAAVLIMGLPGQKMVSQPQANTVQGKWQDIQTGSRCLWLDAPLRYALFLQLIAAIAGAEILVNTVGYVQGPLGLGQVEYGWLMAAFGIGATGASIGLGRLGRRFNSIIVMSLGALLITLAILPVTLMPLGGLVLLWTLAGMGQTFVNLPTQNLIADRVAVEIQGRVYGAHFAWSHLWWAFAYPLAGGLGRVAFPYHFLWSGLLSLVLLSIGYLVYRPQQLVQYQAGLWHDHEHHHQGEHYHSHPANPAISHSHLHFHSSLD
ncbi:MAG: MFS transporter [Alkalinema sp. RU_4_3]|nr:MFS transporter [Alkalinema sp. RU_4_3]